MMIDDGDGVVDARDDGDSAAAMARCLYVYRDNVLVRMRTNGHHHNDK